MQSMVTDVRAGSARDQSVVPGYFGRSGRPCEMSRPCLSCGAPRRSGSARTSQERAPAPDLAGGVDSQGIGWSTPR